MPKYACITLDMELDYGDSEKRIHLLENAELLDRYVSIINKYGAKVTMFTVTSLFENFGDDFHELANRIPLEFAAHSHSHNPYNGCGRDEVEASKAAFLKFTGIPPVGYRAPMGRIDKDGLSHLMDFGYQYDSSIYPSVRPGKFGYSNLHLPNMPFWVTCEGQKALLEFPFTAISTIRVVYALSYAKLFGWGLYSMFLNLFGLPDVVLLLVHPYNFYTQLVASGLSGLEKFALTRNDKKSFGYFEELISVLKKREYEFLFVSEIYQKLKDNPQLKRLTWEDWH